jgi:hypothetical protein
MDLTYTAQVMYNAAVGKALATFYPLNAGYNTGTTTASSKTETSLIKGYPTTQAGWMKFDVSSIPDGATINSIEFHGYVNAANYPYWNINPVTNDPVTSSASALYSDIMAESASGYYLYRSEASSYTSGWKIHTLGGNANANLQAALAQNWFAIGIMDRDASSSYYIGFDGWNETNKPYLIVNYTYIPPYTWLKINGSGSSSGTILPGNTQQQSIEFDAGTLATGTYTANIKISSNDPDQPLVSVPCTFSISNNHNLQITALLEGLYDGGGVMRKAKDATGDRFTGNVADQVTIELHDAANYSNIIYSAANIDLTINGIAYVLVPASHNGSYYVTVQHRNSITTTTASPVSFAGASINYDFSTSLTQAYGSNLKAMGGRYLIYGGDVNQDGSIDSGDMTPLDNDATSYLSGYLNTDVNGDGSVDSGDMTIVDNNGSDYISSKHP